MEMLKQHVITVKDIKAEMADALMEKRNEEEDFDERYDRIHAEWEVKGLKQYREEINAAFTNKDCFKDWVTEIWGDIETGVAVIEAELKLREIEATREAVECGELVKVYVSSESGRRDEAQQKVIENLEEGLNNHDKGVMNLFNVEVAPLLAWTEELLAIRAYLTGEDYVAGSFTNELRNIYKNSFVLLDTNLDSDVSSSYASSSHAHPLQYYVNLEDEWEFLYLDDLNIIDTRDALLICKKGSSQKVKQVVELLKDSDLIHTHVTTHRPWGTYTVLEDESGYKIKRIVVKPGKRLSLQKHYHRNEHWIVVSGTATVTIGERNFLLRENESTFIKMGEIHRLENEGKIPVVLIEAQVGSYTGEDDIIRIEDDFNRN